MWHDCSKKRDWPLSSSNIQLVLSTFFSLPSLHITVPIRPKGLNSSDKALGDRQDQIDKISVILTGDFLVLYFLESFLVEGHFCFVLVLVLRMLVTKPDEDYSIHRFVNKKRLDLTWLLKLKDIRIVKRISINVAYPILSVLFSDDVLGLEWFLGSRYFGFFQLDLSLLSHIGLFFF